MPTDFVANGTANPPIRTSPESKETDRSVWRWVSACSRISGIWSGRLEVRADMESAHAVPIVTSGRGETAGRVIGIVA